MMRSLFQVVVLLLGLVISNNALSDEASDGEPKPLDPDYYAEHHFVLMNGAYSLFAANIASYQKPTDVQLIYKMDYKDPTLFFLVRDADKVTVKTKPFNIERLLRGESLTVSADVYMGDYDNGGHIIYKDMDITFGDKLYSRHLNKDNLKMGTAEQRYDVIQLDAKDRLLVHLIESPPSFAHIVLLHGNNTCLTEFRTSQVVPDEMSLLRRFMTCGSLKPMHYDAKRYR